MQISKNIPLFTLFEKDHLRTGRYPRIAHEHVGSVEADGQPFRTRAFYVAQENCIRPGLRRLNPTSVYLRLDRADVLDTRDVHNRNYIGGCNELLQLQALPRIRGCRPSGTNRIAARSFMPEFKCAIGGWPTSTKKRKCGPASPESG